MKFRTVAYKGSKRKLLRNIEHYCEQIGASTFFDGFSGTGIVGANIRSKGCTVTANDLNYSSFVYGSVFLNGYDPGEVQKHLDIMNSVSPKDGWLTQNYSGEKERKIRGTNGRIEKRPLGFTKNNAAKIDAARDYVETISGLDEKDRKALVFSVVLGADKVFNNSNDQKSSLKNWSAGSKKDVEFLPPTLVSGPLGQQFQGDILSITPKADLVYLDPPYTHGVLYASCYHLNDSIASWDKPELDGSYAVPRPKDICFRVNGQKAGGFYSKKSATEAFSQLVRDSECKQLVLSYSDAPRNTLTIQELVDICAKHGEVYIESLEHQICTQPNSLNKISTKLKEFFIVVRKG